MWNVFVDPMVQAREFKAVFLVEPGAPAVSRRLVEKVVMTAKRQCPQEVRSIHKAAGGYLGIM